MSQTFPKPLRDLALIKLSFADQSKLAALSINFERDSVPHVQLEESLRAISRRFERFAMKNRVLDLYTNNRIVLVSNRETVQIPSVLPAWRLNGTNGVIACVNVTQYTPHSGAGDIDARKLFGFMSIGAVLVDAHTQWNKVSASVKLSKASAAVYSRMMFKVIDRIAGVGSDRLRSDQIKFLMAKYYLIGMLGRAAGEATDALATNTVTIGSSNAAIVDFETSVATAAGAPSQIALYSLPISNFIEALGKSAPWLNRLTFRGFLQNFASLYDPPSVLMMEDATYFLALMSSHQCGAEIIKSFSFDGVYGKEGDEAIDELARLVHN